MTGIFVEFIVFNVKINTITRQRGYKAIVRYSQTGSGPEVTKENDYQSYAQTRQKHEVHIKDTFHSVGERVCSGSPFNNVNRIGRGAESFQVLWRGASTELSVNRDTHHRQGVVLGNNQSRVYWCLASRIQSLVFSVQILKSSDQSLVSSIQRLESSG